MASGGVKTPIGQGMLARVGGALRNALPGNAVRGADWFGPGKPLDAVAPQTHGRTIDYPVGWNLLTTPRGETGENGVGFSDLRALADPTMGGLGLLRLAIETRKDQMESQRWYIRGRDESDGGDVAREIENELRFPDMVLTFAQWQRVLLDDLLVIDAPTIYLAPSTKGHLIPQIMDGALLRPMLTPDGRTPLPPANAYMQVLKGIPATYYTLDEIIRTPRNLRSYRVYGMSPVEQVQMIASIALRREVSQLEYFTAGSVPDVLLGAPENWSAEQIREIQTWLDSELAGQTDARRRMRLVPGGIKPFPLKDAILKDEFDEWLARIICYAFSLSPQALIKQVNRASADTMKQSAAEEGLEPLKSWFKDTLDAVLVKGFDAPEHELWYRDEEITDPLEKAKVYQVAVGKPWTTIDEAREAFGLPELTDKQRQELAPPPPVMPRPGPGGDGRSPPPPSGNGATKKPGDVEQPAAEKVTKNGHDRRVEFILNEKGEIVGAVERKAAAS